MNRQEFENLLQLIRKSEPDPPTVEAAAERVRRRLELDAGAGPCALFRADFAAYRAGTLGEARRMLVEDHLHSCVACRRLYWNAEKVTVLPVGPRRGRRMLKWTAVAAAAALVWAAVPVLDRALAPSGPRATVASLEGSLVLVSGQSTASLETGAAIEQGQRIRTGPDSRALIRLRDGSMVEMDQRSQLHLSEMWRSRTVHLEQGNVIVEAAPQGRGRLQVATADCLVTVRGTIFSVSQGLKGSRISVVEGTVAVDQPEGGSVLLKPGQQAITHESIARTAVADDIAWSANSAKYLALLAGLEAVGRDIARIPLPGLRYHSRLLDRVPADSAIVVSLPNLRQTLAEAERIIEDHARRSPALAEWWMQAGNEIGPVIGRVREISEYLGEEVILAAQVERQPVVLAEVRRAGLQERLAQLGFRGPVAVEGSVAVLGAAAVPPVSQFSLTRFGMQILERYRAGVGLLFAADMEQFVRGDRSASNMASLAGVDNLRYLIAESKTNLGSAENTVSLSFAGARHGIASWLHAPGPMGTLEFVSPQASFAAAFLARDPRLLLEELLRGAGLATAFVSDLQRQTNVNLLDDVAGSLGGEAALAIDGPLLPVPGWKAAIEVQSPMRLQTAIGALVAAVQTAGPAAGFALSSETVNNRTYYALTLSQPAPLTIHYTYVDGYLLAGATRALLDAAIRNRASALTLPRSAEFRSRMPLDGHNNFSAIFYYNLGSAVAPLVDQLKTSGLLAPEQEAAIASLTANREPSLIYVYGERERIVVGSRSGLLGLGLQAMAGLATGNLMQGMPPGIRLGRPR